MRAYSGNTTIKQNNTSNVKNWSDQLEAIKDRININSHFIHCHSQSH